MPPDASNPTSAARAGIPAGSPRWLILGLAALFALLVVKTAWIGDDAYISFRSVRQVLLGNGLVWNTGERVQAFTNPLWVLLLVPAHALSGGIYFSALVYGLGFSVASVLVACFRGARTAAAAAFAVVALGSSKAFVEYSTSGLENPLLHFLLGLSLVAFFHGGRGPGPAFRQALLAALVALTRLDALLFVAPLVLAHLAGGPRLALLGRTALGFLPLVLWEVFSLVYYGFPFPNTAYAKLSTGLPGAALAGQGLEYLANSLAWDPPTLVLVAAGLAAALVRRRGRELLVALAVLLHLAYVVSVGGDFMSGRFLTPDLYCAVFLLAQLPTTPRIGAAAAVSVLALGLVSDRAPLRTGSDFGEDWPRDHLIDAAGISDERATYFQYTGLFTRELMGGVEPYGHVSEPHPQAVELVESGVRVLPSGWIGVVGYWVGPHVHIIDKLGLADPLLGRMPIYHDGLVIYPRNAVIPGRRWRIGHYYRDPPPGYVQTVRDGENVLHHESLHAYYDLLSPVVHGPLWTRERWRAIWVLNTGGADHLLREHAAQVAQGPR